MCNFTRDGEYCQQKILDEKTVTRQCIMAIGESLTPLRGKM
ncbi:hypothetical protein SEHO0A_00743 [Salmonella enterica subsp. houtenae str. ATCC BAA-1581]|nr:hypothetical protein SEHO0A_00743 [Salmonella enterica subsp. houtenae str. ATCC BAA-1581]ENZ87637.1 hypothetical protein D088_930036 [Salmonella enterica subsp. houtenae serovar 16:z4,z32:-- str. RKS3027]